jgi:hypothetical protein
MNLELFSCPFFIGNIDLKKIKLKAEMGKAWLSETPSSIHGKNDLPTESADYLMEVIAELLREKYLDIHSFSISLLGTVWRNEYLDKDFQEPHMHIGAAFSFIIYEKVTEVHTIFFNPAKYLIPATFKTTDAVMREFKPNVRAGQILVFPSYVEHMVNRNSDQVTISGNIDFKFLEVKREEVKDEEVPKPARSKVMSRIIKTQDLPQEK